MGRRSTVMIAIWMVLIARTGSGIAQQSKIPSEVWQKAQTAGVVRVIVQLDVPTRPEGALGTRQAALTQRQAIAARQSDLLADLAGTTYKVARRFETIPFLALEVTPDALAVLERSPRVVGVAEDRLAAPSLQGSVPLVEADQAWAAGFDGTGFAVAVLDTGVDQDHPFLAGKVVEEACFSGNGNCPDGSTMQIGPRAGVPCTYAVRCSHGTHVAGIAAGRGDTFSGVAKGANLIAIQVASRVTGPNCAEAGAWEDPCALFFTTDTAAGLERVFALRDTLQIASVNISLAERKFTDQASCDADVANAMTKAAIDNLRSVGIATVAGSGNDRFYNALSAPACISTAVSVGATMRDGPPDTPESVPPFSNSAPFLSLLAPGTGINSSVPGGGFSTMIGTSQASPHVAGAWAILKQRSPTATVSQVLSALKCTGLKITDIKSRVITPRIRIFQALNMLVRGPTVEIIDVPGAIPGSTRAFGINDTGQIVGTFDVIEQDGLHTHGFLQDTDGSFTRIDVDGARGTQAGGINNSGVIVGTFQDGTGTHGFVRDTDGSFTRIDVDGALETNASGINSSGVIVGTFDVIEQDRLNTHGFIKVGGIFARIDVDGALDTLAFGINSPEGYLSEHLGQIVGWFQDLTGRHGFLRATDGSFTSFDFPSAAQTYAVGINDSGQIVGSFLLDPGRWHGFLRDTDGSLTSFDVPLPGSTDTQLFGINNGGQIVGLFWRGGTRAFTLCGAELTMGPR